MPAVSKLYESYNKLLFWSNFFILSFCFAYLSVNSLLMWTVSIHFHPLSPSKCSPSYLAFTNSPHPCWAPTLLLSPHLFLSPRVSFQSYSRRWTPATPPPSLEPYPASPWMMRMIPSCQPIQRGEWGSTSAPSLVTSPLPTSSYRYRNNCPKQSRQKNKWIKIRHKMSIAL